MNYREVNGEWPAWIHGSIYSHALRGILTGREINLFQRVSREVDSFRKNYGQAKSNNQRHSLCSGGQERGACAQQIMSNIMGNIRMARNSIAATGGITDTAVHYLAVAGHTLSDMPSPEHSADSGEPLDWGDGSKLDEVTHFLGESSIPGLTPMDFSKIGQAIRNVVALMAEAGVIPASAVDGKTQQAIDSFIAEWLFMSRGIQGKSTAGRDDELRQCALGNPAGCNPL